MLNGKQRRYLRGEASTLKPTVSVGKEGITDAVRDETIRQLLSSELIKVRVQKNYFGDLSETAKELADITESDLSGKVGRTFILYRENKDNKKIQLP